MRKRLECTERRKDKHSEWWNAGATTTERKYKTQETKLKINRCWKEQGVGWGLERHAEGDQNIKEANAEQHPCLKRPSRASLKH